MMKNNYIFLLLVLAVVGVQGFFFHDKVTVTPLSSGCGAPEGKGYVIPMRECFHYQPMYYVYADFIESSGYKAVNFSYYTSHKCEPESIYDSYNYDLDQCLLLSVFSENVLGSVSVGEKYPEDAVHFTYYYEYEQENKCKGKSFNIFYTNNYTNDDYNYQCIDNQPVISQCEYEQPNNCSIIPYKVNQCISVNDGGPGIYSCK